MFCSKCGKQIADDALFCEGCGNPTGSSQNSAVPQQAVYVQTAPAGQYIVEKAPSIPVKEKEWKIMAIAMFVVQTVLTLGLLVAIVASEGKMIFSFIGDYPEWLLEKLWNEIGGLCYFVTIIYAAVQIFLGVSHYMLAYTRRMFNEHKRQVIASCISDALMGGLMPVAIGIVLAEETDGEISFMLVFIGIILLALNIATAVFYHKAGDIESFEKYKEGKVVGGNAAEPSAYDPNRALSRLADLANGGSGNVPNKWICNSCGTQNNNTDSFCSGCGKYK